MHLRNTSLLISLLVAASFFYVQHSTAAQNNLTARLLLNQSLIHDSNFYYDPYNEIDVVTYLLQPGIEMGYETGKSEFALLYTLNANFYDESAEDDFYGHTFDFNGDIALSDRLSLKLSDNYIKSRDTTELDELGNIRTREKYYQNRLKGIFSLDFEPKFTTRFGYQNWITDYDQNISIDSTGNQGIFDLIYHLNSSTSLDLEYHYWDMDYDGPVSDYTANQLSIVARKAFRIIELEAGVGYQKREFDGAGLEDIEVIPYRLTLRGSSSSGKTRFALSTKNNFNFLDRNDQGYFTGSRYSLSINYDLTGKITVGISGYYQSYDYENISRDDDIYNIMADINYQFRDNLAIYFSAGQEERSSNIPIEEYKNMEILGQVRFFYDLVK